MTALRWIGAMLAIAAWLTAAPVAAAGMYKWVDEDGNVHYSQTPPPSGEAEELKPPPGPAASGEAIEEQRKESEEALTPVPPPTADIEAEEERKRVYKHNCESARRNLEIYKRHRNVIDEEGERVTLSDEQRRARINEANRRIEKFCEE